MARMTVFRWLLVVALALPGLAASQEAVWTVQPRRGWLGVSINFTGVVLDGRERVAAEVELVTPESPAAAAGISAGDTITHVDGQMVTQRVLDAMRQDLDPGDLVRMTLRRDGRTREVLVEAAPWPADEHVIVMPNSGEMVIRLDSIRGAILQNLDSLALSFRQGRPDSLGMWNLEVLRAPSPGPGDRSGLEFRYRIFEPAFDSLRLSPEVFFMGPETAFPFETFESVLVRSPTTDSIRSALDHLGRTLTQIRRNELDRVRELQAARIRVSEETLRGDERIRELRARETVLLEEQDRLKARLRMVSEEEMKRQWAEVQAQSQEIWARTRERGGALSTERAGPADSLRRVREQRTRELEAGVYTPQRIIAIGQSFILGAQLQALNPDLAEYFGVDEGVLVTKVVEGTPASEAGLRGGDIIVRVGGDPVASMEDLRVFFGHLRGPLRVGVVRKGRGVELLVGG